MTTILLPVPCLFNDDDIDDFLACCSGKYNIIILLLLLLLYYTHIHVRVVVVVILVICQCIFPYTATRIIVTRDEGTNNPRSCQTIFRRPHSPVYIGTYTSYIHRKLHFVQVFILFLTLTHTQLKITQLPMRYIRESSPVLCLCIGTIT